MGTGGNLTRRVLPAFLLACLAAIAGPGAGCSGGPPDPMEMLRRAGARAAEVSQSSTTLRVRESLYVRVDGEAGYLRQEAELEGALQMPDRERYEYRETWSGSLVDPAGSPPNTLSYVTLDGGRTAYVKGSRLERGLGVAGWVYYAPESGESRYFDYLQAVQAVTGYASQAVLLGEEEANGIACWRLEVVPSMDAMVQEQFEHNPAFAEQYREARAGRGVVEAREEIWISREGFFPMRIYTMMVVKNAEADGAVALAVQMDFEGYGEALLLPIDAPAVYTKVE